MEIYYESFGILGLGGFGLDLGHDACASSLAPVTRHGLGKNLRVQEPFPENDPERMTTAQTDPIASRLEGCQIWFYFNGSVAIMPASLGMYSRKARLLSTPHCAQNTNKRLQYHVAY